MESHSLTQHKAIEIRIANVGLVPKLDAIGAALAAVREAHRDQMSVKCWAAINRANDQIAEAILAAGSPQQCPAPLTLPGAVIQPMKLSPETLDQRSIQ